VMEGRVLSLQSHVVSGYVGNKSATLPLQLLGLEVEAVNSVQFSNHTGYGSVKGQVMDAQQLEAIIAGLEGNGLLSGRYSHLLTGYIGSASFLRAVQQIILKLKKANPGLLYVCDPVMGDNGHMYVPAELLPIYRESIVPLADVIVPNQYEAELLSGMPIRTEADVGKVLQWFHGAGVATVVLSSTALGADGELLCLASTVRGQGQQLRLVMPRLPLDFTGTGDLFAALLLGWLHRTDHDLKTSLENTVFSMQCVLNRTLQHAQATSAAIDDSCQPNTFAAVTDTDTATDTDTNTVSAAAKKAAAKELRLVQSVDDIRSPRPSIEALPMRL